MTAGSTQLQAVLSQFSSRRHTGFTKDFGDTGYLTAPSCLVSVHGCAQLGLLAEFHGYLVRHKSMCWSRQRCPQSQLMWLMRRPLSKSHQLQFRQRLHLLSASRVPICFGATLVSLATAARGQLPPTGSGICQLCCKSNQFRCLQRVVDAHMESQRQVTMFQKVQTLIALPQDCPTPEIYPGSTLYGEEVHGQFPGDLSERYPEPHPWSPCSTVDLNKLHFDRPMPKNQVDDVPVVMQRQVLVFQKVQKNFEIPQVLTETKLDHGFLASSLQLLTDVLAAT